MTDIAKTSNELLAGMRELPVIDAHEHLMPEKDRVARKNDALDLFGQYTRLPMFASGLPRKDWEKSHDTSIDVVTRFRLLSAYLPRIRHTSFARAAGIAMEHFWNVSVLTEENVVPISEQIAADSSPGLYERVLRRHCNIRRVLNQDTLHCGDLTDLDAYSGQSLLAPIVSLIDTRPQRGSYARMAGRDGFKTLDEYIEWAKSRVLALAHRGALGFKTVSLPYLDPDRSLAENEYRALKEEGREPLAEVTRPGPLLSYVHETLLGSVQESRLPVAVHTGVWGDFRDLDPTHFIPILKRFPGIHFDLFHAGIPYVRETGMMALNFANTSINLCWAHSVNAAMAGSALDEYIDSVGTDKIIGFGGDVAWMVEKVYGHLELARWNTAGVLAGRIARGLLDQEGALELARSLFFENPKRIYFGAGAVIT